MSTGQDIEVTYDRETDFYRLWLEGRMIYTCALFNRPSDTLEEAQERKLHWFYDRRGFRPSSSVTREDSDWTTPSDSHV